MTGDTGHRSKFSCVAGVRCDGPVVDPTGSIVRSLVTNWMADGPRYLQLDTGTVRATLLDSFVQRDGQFDIIVSNITATIERNGHGTAFMLELLDIARSLQPPRGVQLQQVITPASRGLASRLCSSHNWRWSEDEMSAFSQ